MTKQELVNFLLTLDKQHINELVDILTDFSKGRMSLNSSVKDVLIYAKELNQPFTYHEINLLIQEFQEFGGNSIANVFRNQNNLVSYDEILNDVYSRITNCVDNSSEREKEKAIILKLIGENWQQVDFNIRYDKSLNFKYISQSIISGAIGNNAVNTFIKFAATRVNPLVMGGSIVADTMSEAYRITIPFIVQIAWLKLKYGFYQTKKSTFPVIKESSTEVLLVDDNQNPIVSLSEYVNELPSIKNTFNNSNISIFNQLLNNIPSLVTKYETVKNHIVSINIDPAKLTPAKDGNGLRGMVHGYNKNGHFGIVENVRIFEADTLKQVVNANILWGLASTVVAQKHLADINEKLKEIQKDIDDIKNFLSDERSSQINSALKNIHFIMEQIKLGNNIPKDIKDILKQQFEKNLSIQDHLQKDLQKSREKIIELKFDSFAGRNNQKDLQKLNSEIKLWEKHYQEYELCCNVIMMIFAILYFTSEDLDDKNYFIQYTRNLKNESTKFLLDENIYLSKHLESAHHNSKGITNMGNTEMANEAFFKSRIENFSKYKVKMEKELALLSNLMIKKAPIKATLLIENGQVVGGQFIE